MKKIIITPVLFLIFFISCKQCEQVNNRPGGMNQNSKVTSIDATKNGEPFINYLGEKTEGC